MSEKWTPITGYVDFYEVSDLSRVRSLSRVVKSKNESTRKVHGQILKQVVNSDGYYMVALCREGHKKTFLVHRLVGSAYIAPSWKGEFDHKDNDKLNNLPLNLRPATRVQQLVNQRPLRGGHSVYKGVYDTRRRKNPWRVRIGYEGKQLNLGVFRTEALASRAYNIAALRLYGDFANLNPSSLISQKNPNSWSCLLTAFSIILDKSIEQLVEQLGMDGSKITHVDLPEPLCREGFHIQQFIKICLEDKITVTRVELFPTAVPQIVNFTKLKSFDVGGWQWFRKNLFHSTGVIDCRTAVGTGHAMAYQGMGNHALIFDPANGDEFEFRKPEDTEGRDRFLVALWRLDDITP